MKTILTIILASLFVISSVSAMNLWSSTPWFSGTNVTVEQGYKGEIGYYFEYGTRDNVTYDLEITEDSGLMKLERKPKQITNGVSYRYDVKLHIHPKLKPGFYPVNFCGTICNPTNTLCYSTCWARGRYIEVKGSSTSPYNHNSKSTPASLTAGLRRI